MKRTLRGLIGAAALLAALPATASADTVEGVVVARDAGLQTVVVAGRGGSAATLRVARPASFRPGLRVRATASRLADGSYRPSTVKRRGRAGAARLRFTLIRRAGREALVTAGGSTFALKAGGAVSRAGALVAARLKVVKGKVSVAKSRQVGQAGTLELRGRVVDLAGGVLRLAVGGSGPVAIAVPAGAAPALEPGDLVTVLVAVGADGSFTVVAVDGELEAHGAIAAVGGGSITVGAVTCAVPEDLEVSDLVAGDVITLYCALVGGVLTAEDLEFDDLGFDDGDWGFEDEEPWDEEEIDPEE